MVERSRKIFDWKRWKINQNDLHSRLHCTINVNRMRFKYNSHDLNRWDCRERRQKWSKQLHKTSSSPLRYSCCTPALSKSKIELNEIEWMLNKWTNELCTYLLSLTTIIVGQQPVCTLRERFSFILPLVLSCTQSVLLRFIYVRHPLNDRLFGHNIFHAIKHQGLLCCANVQIEVRMSTLDMDLVFFCSHREQYFDSSDNWMHEC